MTAPINADANIVVSGGRPDLPDLSIAIAIIAHVPDPIAAIKITHHIITSFYAICLRPPGPDFKGRLKLIRPPAS